MGGPGEGIARRVFLSHTAELRGFPRERSFVAAAERAVALAGDQVIDMEYFGARDADPAEFCVRAVRSSDVYLGLIAFRYGTTVPGQAQVSYTELEFDTATAAGIPRLVFLLDYHAEVPFGDFVDEAHAERQRAFRARLRESGIITAGFRDAGELETAVLDALVKLREAERRAAVAVTADIAATTSTGASTEAMVAARPPAPWMVPVLPDGFVPRPALAAAVLAELRPGAGPVVLHGTGGIGKTTLAREVCQRVEIAPRFPGGLLWVTVGESLRGAQLADRINDLSEALAGVRPTLSDPEQAGFHLGTLLAGDARLLVIDDVWSRDQVEPFLQGGPNTMRLVTTRLRDVLPRCRMIEIPAMRRAEAMALLLRDLPPGSLPTGTSTGGAVVLDGPVVVDSALAEGAERLLAHTGRWPVLLSLVNRALVRYVRDGMSPARAVERVRRRMERRGPTGLDVTRAGQRAEAVEVTLAASLDLLTGHRLQRYLELAVFPEDVEVPRAILDVYWGRTGDLDPDEVDDLCQELADLSLVVTYRRAPAALLLQDVLRSYLRVRVGVPRLAELEAVLCDALRDAHLPSARESGDPWWLLPASASYAWTYLVGHLLGAGRVDAAGGAAGGSALDAGQTGTPAAGTGGTRGRPRPRRGRPPGRSPARGTAPGDPAERPSALTHRPTGVPRRDPAQPPGRKPRARRRPPRPGPPCAHPPADRPL
uniref:DUF4062 domain-containing protein n=1 Tax=Candidatus Frankia nodulisporulans TaxID=2060052 RepID=UPI0037045D38